MTPNLAAAQRDQIYAMIRAGHLTTGQIAYVVGCISRSVKAVRSNLRVFGSPNAPRTVPVGRSRAIASVVSDALKEMRLSKPDRRLDELAAFLQDDFEAEVSNSAIMLKEEGRSRRTIRRKAKEQNADLRDKYLHYLTSFASYHLVYIDESGCDRGVRFCNIAKFEPNRRLPCQAESIHQKVWESAAV